MVTKSLLAAKVFIFVAILKSSGRFRGIFCLSDGCGLERSQIEAHDRRNFRTYLNGMPPDIRF